MSDGLSISRRDLMKAGGLAAVGLGVSTSGCLAAIDEEMQVPRTSVATQCWIGKQDCSLYAGIADGRLIKLNGNPEDPRTEGGVCVKGQAQISQVYEPTRVKRPLKRTNAKGEHGTWQEVSWDQALSEIGETVAAHLEDDPRRVIFQTGREKAPVWHADGFVKAMDAYAEQASGHTGVRYYTNQAVASGAMERMQELTYATTGGTESDFENCEYLLAWGTGLGVSGGANMCQITWPRQIVQAKEDHDMKVVVLDPQRRPSGGDIVDEWIPIEPGTDLAFFLALNHVLVREDFLDREYLRYATNAPCLVDPKTGYIIRSDDADDPATEWEWPHGELVFDSEVGEIRGQEFRGSPVLEGTFTYEGREVKPAFELYKEHIQQYTPEWAAGITGIDASTIERIAMEWGEHASIGESRQVEGWDIPVRPVATHGFHVGQNTELGMPTVHAQQHLSMLVGAVDVIGSTRPRRGDLADPSPKREEWRRFAFHPVLLDGGADGPALEGTPVQPISSDGYSLVPRVLADPDGYDLPHPPEDLLMFVQMANPVMSAPQTDVVIEGLSKLGTVIAVDPFLSETADMVADYVLPAATLDKLEGPGPNANWNGKASITGLRNPVMEPLWESKSDPEIYARLANAIGIESEYLESVNDGLGLTGFDRIKLEEFAQMDPDEFIRDALDRWARDRGKNLRYFTEEGQVLVEEWGVDDPRRYNYFRAVQPIYAPYGVKHEFYSETLERLGDAVRERGMAEEAYPFVDDYNGYPTWRKPTMFSSPPEYDLTLITYKQIEHMHSRTANNRMLNELAPRAPVKLNPLTARERGISDGDHVELETHNAVTGETYTVEGVASIVRGIRPGVVAVAHHHGNWNEVADVLDEGPNVNAVIPSGPGYMGIDGSQSFQVRAMVSPTGGGEH